MPKSHCTTCHAGTPTLSDSQVQQALESLPGWEFDKSKKRIFKRFDFKGFYKTMAFVNAIAWVAHNEQHHPDMQVSYNQVIVSYQTHEAGGITENDMICARLVDALS